MSKVRLRPTFRMAIEMGRDEAIERIRTRLAEDERFSGRWRGKGRWADVHVPHAERRFWSPHLSLRLDSEEEGRCTLFGRFAPHPEVWTFFMFLYVASWFGAVFGLVLGYVQWASNEAAWGMWAGLGSGIAIALIHVAGALGQRLGREQMLSLRDELDGVLEGLPVTVLDVE